jgi:formylglycine-generating enzyme required for sulfatase activity
MDELLVNSIGMKFALIQPGEFLMGSPNTAPRAQGLEKPQYRVRITKPFYFGVYEVTQAQYEQVVGINPSVFKGESRPVESVSLDDAEWFCQRLERLPEERSAGRIYRLPWEAEWEYACRAGTTSEYSFGDSEGDLGNYAWYDENSNRVTHPVGQKRPNPWGLYDMHGNVWEWCQDWYRDYVAHAVDDPRGTVHASHRVSRGGCWRQNAEYSRSACRYRWTPSDRYDHLGFRVVLNAPRVSYL